MRNYFSGIEFAVECIDNCDVELIKCRNNCDEKPSCEANCTNKARIFKLQLELDNLPGTVVLDRTL